MTVTDTNIPKGVTVDGTTLATTDGVTGITTGFQQAQATKDLIQDLNILVNSASASALYDYDDMFADLYSDANGYDGTIDTGNTDGTFSTNLYNNQSAEAQLVIDTTTYSEAGISYVLKKTFSGLDNFLTKGEAYLWVNTTGSINRGIQMKFTYEDTTTATVTKTSTNYEITHELRTFTNPNPTKKVTQVQVYLAMLGGSGRTAYMNNIALYDFDFIEADIQTNAITIDANPSSHQMFATTSGTGTLTYDISFDGGSTWVTDQPLNTKNTSVHDGTSMIIKQNLTAVTLNTVSNYAVMLGYL